MSRLVVADTGPLIHLAQADVLALLELTGEILVPGTVLDELERGQTDISEVEFAGERVTVSTNPRIRISTRERQRRSFSAPNEMLYY